VNKISESDPDTDVQEICPAIIIQIFWRKQAQIFICEIKAVLLISPALDIGVIENIGDTQVNINVILVIDPY